MITAHCLVKNEENFIWYSINSVINYIDKILIWDTGSTDSTVKIINELQKKYPDKISFEEKGNVNEREYSDLRQKMLDATGSNWIMILDGDEIWWQDSISKVIQTIKDSDNKYESIIVPTINLVGDIFHYQDKNAGKYQFGNKTGHYALRFINKNIPSLHVGNIYGKEGFFDESGAPIQNRNENKILFVDSPYIHATHLERSSKDIDVMQRNWKRKAEIGIEFSKDFYYPESFFESRPDEVPNIWKNMPTSFKVKSAIFTPFRKIKRII